MKVDDRVEKYDARLVVVFKNHLGCEQFLDELLTVAKRRRRGRNFAGKSDVAKGLFLPEIGAQTWAVLKAGNKLRNAIAHGEPEGTIRARMEDLRKEYVADVSPEQREGVEQMNETQLVTSAFTHCGGHLVVATDHLREKQG